MPLPFNAWTTVREDGAEWREDSSKLEAVGNNLATARAGHVLVPAEHSTKDNATLKVVAGAVVEKTQGEIDSEALTKTRATAKAKAVDAELTLLGLNSLHARLTSAGKVTSAAVIQVDIDALDAKIANALVDLP